MATTITTDALNALLYIYNGYEDSRWNFFDAVGTSEFNPGGLGNSVSLTYSFLSSRPAWASPDEVSFGVLNASMKVAAEKVLTHISEVANIDFTKVAAQQGQITFATSDQDTGSSAWAYGPFFQQSFYGGNITAVNEIKIAGSVWINNDPTMDWTTASWQPGAFGYSVLLHEMGHALGLKHPFHGDDFGGGFILDPALDHEGDTVMSYSSAPRSLLVVDGGSTWKTAILAPSTMMMMDIEALQHLYGANMDHESGNTAYEWGTNEELLETIWDGGGVDTLDCSNQVFTCRIDLREGQFSSIGLRRTDAEIRLGLDLPTNLDLSWLYDPNDVYNGENNLGIAKGAIIENATGGSANDIIVGNNVANRLVGGLGNDKLTGSGGADRLDGGRGVDNMNGGAGKDLFDFNRLTDMGKTLVKADVISGFVSGADRIDLSTIDANTALAGNQAFTFIEDEAFSAADATGQVRFQDGVLYGSTDADTAVEFMVKLTGGATLTAADLLL